MIKRGIIAGVVILIVGLVLNFGIGSVIPQLAQEYKNTNIFRPWSDPLIMVYFAYPFVLGIVLSYLWNLLDKQFSGKPFDKAFQFAKIYFIAATIPGMFISYTSLKLSLMMIIVWALTGFLQALVAGLVFAKVK